MFAFKLCESEFAEVVWQQAQTARREKVVFILVAIEQDKIFSWYSSTYYKRTEKIFLPIKNDKQIVTSRPI